MGSSRLRTLALAIMLAWVPDLAFAQIFYTVPGPTDAIGRPTAFLRQVNPNGSGDVAVVLPGVPTPQVPTISRDGRFLAVTSLDPTRPMDLSGSVYQWDRLTGIVKGVIFFQDMQGLRFVPLHKAYSPDNLFMAVSLSIAPIVGGPAGSETKALQIHDLSSGLPVAAPLLTTPPDDGKSTSGVGVDWSPDATSLLYPIRIVGPNGVESVTPIFVIDPTTGGGFPVTFPVDEQIQLFPPPIITRGEHDYAPAYSPNGVAIAYLRASLTFNSFSIESSIAVSVRITSPNGDRSIFELTQLGEDLIASGVRWSPDGTQLVFDAAPRARLITGVPVLAPDPTLLLSFTINVDGTGLTQLSNATAGQPEWAPVPEPAQALMLAAGIGLLSWLRSLARRRAA